jgi:hypothetical protein
MLCIVPSPRILKKTVLFFGFKNQSAEQENSSLIHEEHFVEHKNEGRKPDKNSRLRRLEFMPKNLELICD